MDLFSLLSFKCLNSLLLIVSYWIFRTDGIQFGKFVVLIQFVMYMF